MAATQSSLIVDTRKRYRGLWDLQIPPELLEKILSGLGLKANVRASAVCKTWCESAVSVRKLKRRPWLFDPYQPFKIPTPGIFVPYQDSPTDTDTDTYVLRDPTSFEPSHHYKLTFPALKGHRFAYSRDGWLLVIARDSSRCRSRLIFFLNPFTGEHIYLPEMRGNCFAFSAAPTSTSCLVISLRQVDSHPIPLIMTWRPGQTAWTTHCFEKRIPYRTWDKCVFSDGLFYCLSNCGYLGVFDPSKATWNVLPVEPCTAFSYPPRVRRVSLMDHEGDIFLMSAHYNCHAAMFKLNLDRKAWEDKTELGGLTVFATRHSSLIIAGLSAQGRNIIYLSRGPQHGVYYSLADKKSSPVSPYYLSEHLAWVDPPPDNLNL